MTIPHIPGTTAAEAEALTATAALIAAGGDPFGDDGDDDASAEEVEAKGDDEADADGKVEPGSTDTDAEAGSAEAAGEDDLSAEALEAVAADDEPEPVATPRYKVGDLAEFKAKRDEQIGIKSKALKDLMDGVIEPEEYSRIESEVTDRLDALTVQRTLHEANVQTEQQQQESALDKIIAAAKKAGEVDYLADKDAAKKFDIALKMLAADGETRTYAELAADAHKAVLAVRGIKKPAPTAEEAAAAAAALAAKPRENGKGPMTLRNIPAAETPTSGGGWKEQLATLSGQAYEDAFAKLSQAQRAEMLND